MGPCSRHTAQGRIRVLSPRDEHTLVRKVQINPRTARDLVKMLEETGTKVSMSTVKWVLYGHNLKGHSARKKPLLQNRHKKSQTTVCNCTWGQRPYFLEKCILGIVVAITKPWPQSCRKFVGRTEKACAREAHKPDSVTPAISGGMDQYSPN
jgi:hypothetical protein